MELHTESFVVRTYIWSIDQIGPANTVRFLIVVEIPFG
jgi:hypothetical protein